MVEKYNSLSKSRNVLGKAQGQGLERTAVSDPGSSAFSPWTAVAISLKATEHQFYDPLEISICATWLEQLPADFIALYDSFLLTLSHSSIANQYRMLLLLKKLIWHKAQLVQDFLLPDFLVFLLYDPLVPRNLTLKNKWGSCQHIPKEASQNTHLLQSFQTHCDLDNAYICVIVIISLHLPCAASAPPMFSFPVAPAFQCRMILKPTIYYDKATCLICNRKIWEPVQRLLRTVSL